MFPWAKSWFLNERLITLALVIQLFTICGKCSLLVYVRHTGKVCKLWGFWVVGGLHGGTSCGLWKILKKPQKKYTRWQQTHVYSSEHYIASGNLYRVRCFGKIRKSSVYREGSNNFELLAPLWDTIKKILKLKERRDFSGLCYISREGQNMLLNFFSSTFFTSGISLIYYTGQVSVDS